MKENLSSNSPKKDPKGILKLAGCLKNDKTGFAENVDEIIKERRTKKFKTPKFD